MRKAWAVLRREGMKVARKRVWAMMHRLGLVLPPWPSGWTLAWARSPSPRPTDAGRMTSTTVWTRQDGWVAVVPLIDCGDRSVLQWEVAISQESSVILALLACGLAEVFGRPENVLGGLEFRSDHGPQYMGRECRDLCRLWRVEHTFAPVGRPTGNAVAERLILTMKTELIWTRDWESATDLGEAHGGFIFQSAAARASDFKLPTDLTPA